MVFREQRIVDITYNRIAEELLMADLAKRLSTEGKADLAMLKRPALIDTRTRWQLFRDWIKHK